MPASFSYHQPRSRESYVAPRGIDPGVYMHDLNAQSEALCREGDLHGALRLMQKRLAVVSYYRGSRTVHAAQAMAKLAYLTRQTDNEHDAHTWAYYAMRVYANLMLDGEARHKQHIAESIAMLDQDYPGLSGPVAFLCSGIPDFTSGKLQRLPRTPVPAQVPEEDRHTIAMPANLALG